MPSTAQIVDAISAQTNLSKSEIFNIGIDVLAFVKSVLDKGGRIGVQSKGSETFEPIQMIIPGITSHVDPL
ncbi:hypothetical protein [Nocardia heshunensis]